jgi:UDP-glucose 4-epimerase
MMEELDKALFTGGAGFIGSNTVEKLVERGVEVVVLDSMYLGDESNLSSVKEDVKIIEGSVMDREKVEEAVEGCDTVFHLAARSSSPMHKEEPAEGSRINIEGFINVVESAIDAGAEKVVYASTSSMYGSIEPPQAEDSGEVPINRYAASKMARERYAQMYSYKNEIETTGLRYFSVFGPHERAKGEYANVVTQFLWKMQNGEKPVIWGDGRQERDFTFVEDVADATIKAAERREELDGEYFNVGAGEPVSFVDVVGHLNDALGTDIEPEHIENPRDKYFKFQEADISKSRNVLGWDPSHSFKGGLKKTVEYYT